MSSDVRRLTISSPDAERAEVLAQRLDRYSADTSNKGDWWCVTMPLDGQPASCVPDVLDAVRQWLRDEQIESTSVFFDGHTHLVYARPGWSGVSDGSDA